MNKTHVVNLVILTILVGIAGYFGFVRTDDSSLGNSSPRYSEPTSAIPAQSADTNQDAFDQDGTEPRLESEDIPEVIQSIYADGLEFRLQAQAAAEEKISYFEADDVLRWRAVKLEPQTILTGNYLVEGSVLRQFQISPFPETRYTVTETSSSIMESTQSVSWHGEIEGVDSGRVEMRIVGGADNPSFVIRIFESGRIISISPTGERNTYVAIEGNPNQPVKSL